MISLTKDALSLLVCSSLALASSQIPITASKPSTIPSLGFGTWNLKISAENTTKAVSAAIEAGYRHIDCAAAYDNQKDVGRGIKKGLEVAGIEREDIWVTSKLWNDHHAPDKVEAGLNQTLKELGLDYLDLYLMHWPVGNDPKSHDLVYDYVQARFPFLLSLHLAAPSSPAWTPANQSRHTQTWLAMEPLVRRGAVRNIGISNFSPHQLNKLIRAASIKPAVHQMELHPYLQQTEWVQWHDTHGIAVTAYSPLAGTNPTYSSSARKGASRSSADPMPLLENKDMAAIAEKRDCTVAQVALAWGMARGTSVIPKSSHEKWIVENYGARECELEEEDYREIERVGRENLKRYNNPSKGWGVHLFEGLDDA